MGVTVNLGEQARGGGPAGRRPHAGPVVVAWLISNLAIGYLMIIPLGVADTLGYYIRAVHLHDDVVVPYGSVGARLAVAEILVASAVLLAAGVLLNRRHWRRLRAAGPRPGQAAGMTAVAMIVGIVVVQMLPFLVFMTATNRTFPPLFPDAWL